MEKETFTFNPITTWGFGDEVAFKEHLDELIENYEADGEAPQVDAIADLKWNFEKDTMFSWKQKD